MKKDQIILKCHNCSCALTDGLRRQSARRNKGAGDGSEDGGCRTGNRSDRRNRGTGDTGTG